MKILNGKNIYLKGTCEITIVNPGDGRIVYQNSKILTNNFQTEVDMEPIRAGLGNTVAIQIPGNATVNLDLTAADFSMQAMAMQTGSKLKYNAIVPVCTTLTGKGGKLSFASWFSVDGNTIVAHGNAANKTGSAMDIADGLGGVENNTLELNGDGQITVTVSPVAAYGDAHPYVYVNTKNADTAGKAYIFDDGEVIGFHAEDGKEYNVMFYEHRADSVELGVSGLFAPGIYSVSAQMAVFSADNDSGSRGSQVGWARYYVPRMQFSGNISLNGSQTEAAETKITGTALGAWEAAKMGDCTDCSFPRLAYMTYSPLAFNGNNAISALAVVGGNLTVAAGDTAVIPVKYVMADNSIVQPNFSDLTITSGDGAIASVANGIMTGVAEGDTTLTIARTAGGVDPITVGVTVTA